MLGEKWVIYWNEYSSDTYLYGSEINFLPNHKVEFKNTLMPPGTVIKKWYSKTNFQRQKIEPSLPMIDGEGEYRISFNITVSQQEHYIGKLIFFDRFYKEIGYLFLRNKEEIFRCPLNTYSYELHLINGGVTHFIFCSVEIQEIIDESEETAKKII